jgi:hypothetical protein
MVSKFCLMTITSKTKNSIVGCYWRMRIGDKGSCHDLLDRNSHLNWSGGVDSLSGLRNDSVEPAVMVSGVFNSPGGAIRLQKPIVTFDLVAYTLLSLLLDVVCVVVFNSVLELVLWWNLK